MKFRLKEDPVIQCFNWFPGDISYFWTSKVLLCRSQSLRVDIFADIVRRLNRMQKEYQEPGCIAPRFLSPGQSAMPNEILQISQNLASNYWFAGYVALLRSSSEIPNICDSVNSFQVECLGRGIDRIGLILIISKSNEHQTQPSDFEDSAGSCRSYSAPMDRSESLGSMIEFSIYRKELEEIRVHCKARGLSLAALEENPTSEESLDRIRRLVKVDITKLINSRLDTDTMEQDAVVNEVDDNFGPKKHSEAKLRKDRGDYLLLLNNPLTAISNYVYAQDVHQSLGNWASQAACSECISACLYLWLKTARDEPGKPLPGTIENVLAVSPNSGTMLNSSHLIVPTTSGSRKTTGGFSLQNFFTDSTTSRDDGSAVTLNTVISNSTNMIPSSSPGPLSGPGVPSNVETTILNAIAARNRNCVNNLYPKVKSGGVISSIVNQLVGCFMEARADVIDTVLESVSGIEYQLSLPVYIQIANLYWVTGLVRKYSWILYTMLNIVLAKLETEPRGAEYMFLWNIVHRLSLHISINTWLPSLHPLLEGDPLVLIQPDSTNEITLTQLLFLTRQHVLAAPSSNLISSLGNLCESSEEFVTDSMKWYKMVPWTMIQVVVLDRLKKAAEHLNLKRHSLWYSYLGLLTSHDIKSQRALINSELSITFLDKVFMLSPTEYQNLNWLIPPSLTIVNLPEKYAKRYKTQFYENNSYTTIGGLTAGRFTYIPHLLAITPHAFKLLHHQLGPFVLSSKSQIIPQVEDETIIRKSPPSRFFTRNDSSINDFIYQPWTKSNANRENVLDSPIFWAVNDINSVLISVHNPLSMDLVLDHCRILAQGATIEAQPLTVGLPPTSSLSESFETKVVSLKDGPTYFIGFSYFNSRVEIAQFLLTSGSALNDTLFEGAEPDAEAILKSSSFANVINVPALPLLELRSSDRFGDDLGCPPGCQNVDNIFYLNQTYSILAQCKNITDITIEHLWIMITTEQNLLKLAPNFFPKDHTTIIYETQDLAENIDFYHGGRKLQRSNLSIPPRESRTIEIRGCITKSTQAFTIKFYYCNKGSNYYREDSYDFELQSQPGVEIEPSSLRIYTDINYITPKFLKLILAQNNSIAEKIHGDHDSDSEFVILGFEVSNHLFGGVRIKISAKVGSDIEISGTHEIPPAETRYLIMQPFKRVKQWVSEQSLNDLLNRCVSVLWESIKDPSIQGKLSFGEGLTPMFRIPVAVIPVRLDVRWWNIDTDEKLVVRAQKGTRIMIQVDVIEAKNDGKSFILVVPDSLIEDNRPYIISGNFEKLHNIRDSTDHCSKTLRSHSLILIPTVPGIKIHITAAYTTEGNEALIWHNKIYTIEIV